MFILNGNRRPKVIFYNEINYSDNPSALPMFGWKKYNNYLVPPTSDNFTGYFSAVANKIKNLKSSVKIDDKFKTMEDILPEDKVESLLLLREKYDAEIFVFTCYEKKKQKIEGRFLYSS